MFHVYANGEWWGEAKSQDHAAAIVKFLTDIGLQAHYTAQQQAA